MSLSSRGYNTQEIMEINKKYRDMAKSKKDKKKDRRKKEEKKYEARRGDKTEDPKNFSEYQDSYGLRKYGAGSDKKPKASRFSGLDVRKMFDAGTDRFGLSKADAARQVLDYADDMKKKTRKGGATKDALDKLRQYLRDKPDKPDDQVKPPTNEDGPPELQEAQERFNETDLTRPENRTPRLDERFTNNPSRDAISGGDDLVQWYGQKFVPNLQAEADYGVKKIGSDMNYFLDKFVYGPPKLGDPSEMFDKYKDEIEEATKDKKKKD